jgi:glycosyltransferase involved in cell wall biosynthesis
MHILIIPSWYGTNESPTLGSFFREQAIALKEQGHTVSLAYTDIYNKLRDKYKGIKYCNDCGVNVYRIAKYKVPRSGFKIYNYVFYKGIHEIYKIISKEIGNVDIIHCHSAILSAYSGMKMSFKYDIPYVITEHYTGFARGLINGDKVSLVKKVFDNANSIISVSNSLKNDIKKYTSNKNIKVIPNMIDTSRFIIGGENDVDKFAFLAVCYLTYKKGIDILIKAFAIAFKDNNNVILRIGGDGEELDNLRKLSIELGVDEKIFFLGALSRDEVSEAMKKCDVFALPSRFETFGVVLIEALACGKPVISTRGEGPDDIIEEYNGMLVEKENVNELADAMKFIYTNKDKYNPIEIRKDCIERFSTQSVSKKIIDLYKEVLSDSVVMKGD